MVNKNSHGSSASLFSQYLLSALHFLQTATCFTCFLLLKMTLFKQNRHSSSVLTRHGL